MGLRVEWVRYGRPAAEALRAAVAAAKADEPLAPVTVVVPSNHVGVAARRLLASGRLGPICRQGVGLAAVTFLTPYRLAELLAAPRLAAAGRRPVSTPVLAAALRGALANEPGLFAPVAAHPATETALVAAYRELRDVTRAGLDRLSTLGARARDLVRLHRAARAHLAPAWYDEDDLMATATEVFGEAETTGTTTGTAAGLGTIVVYLPQRLSRHAGRMLAAAAVSNDVVVLAGSTGDARADSEVADTVARLQPHRPEPNATAPSTTAPTTTAPTTTAPAAGSPPVTPAEPRPLVSAERTRFVTASDADDEVRAAVRHVLDAARSGTPLDRIAIAHASPEPYARLVHEHLAATGVAANGTAVVPLAARMAGRALLQLLALPEGRFRRQEVFAWLGSVPVLDGGRLTPVGAWERLSRDAAVVGGRVDWDQRLATLADDLEADAAEVEADPDQPGWRAERSRADAARARHLRRFVLALIDDLGTAAAEPRGWGEHARWAKQLCDRLLGDATHREQWPADERKAAERVSVAIDRLAALDSVEGAVALDVFTRTLQLELEADLGRVGRFGEGILVGSIAMAVGLDLDLLVILGLAEGSFPASVRDDSLLPDHEREATRGELPLRRRRIDREHRELLAALAGAERHLLCLPRGDLRRSSQRVPSRWALDVACAIGSAKLWSADLLATEAPWIEHVASFDAGLRTTTFPATDQEHRLRSLMAGARQVADPLLERGTEVVTERRSDRFTRFDGNLSGLPVPSPADTVTSPTRLERWADCPFAYLLHDVLGVEPVENPEEQLRITPLDWGNLVHQALERFLLEVLDRPADRQPEPGEPWSPADRARMLAIGEELCDEFEQRGLTGRPIFWRRDRVRILADLMRFLDADTAHRLAHGTRPLAAELAFGLRQAELDAVPLELPDGRCVRFRGKADRVDVADDGTLHIVDYKTGSTFDFKGLGAENPDLGGRKLQLAVYGVAARLHRLSPDAAVLAEYWFVSAKGNFKRIGYHVSPDILDRVGHTLATMVSGIERGVFPNHPTAETTSPFIKCHFCDPDALGVAELRRQWDRKRADPALALFAELAEPLDGVDPVVELDTVDEAVDA